MIPALLSLLVVVFYINVVSLQKIDVSSHEITSDLTKSCYGNDTLFIRGYDLNVQDIMGENGDIYNMCSDSANIEYVYVFALNCLVIDSDINVIGSHLKFFFIAPSWVVVGNRRIAFDGYKGKNIPNAKNGSINSVDGEHGKAGLPGGPGGNFFGIGGTFQSGDSLTITASGGVGGAGQHGGNGYNQESGRCVDVQALGKIWCGVYYDVCRNSDKKYQLNLLDNNGNYSDFICQGLYERDGMEKCSYKIFGSEGEQGGRGGNGGKGGKGGLPGSVELVELINVPSQISKYNTSGMFGVQGKGGAGGTSGQYGPDTIYEDVNFLAPPKITIEVRGKTGNRFGLNGIDGFSSFGYKEDLVKANVLKRSDVINAVNTFKSWVRNCSEHVKNKSHFLLFYKNLEENVYINSFYNITDFLNEINNLNEEFHQFESAADFLPFYESLLGRIVFYVSLFKKDKGYEEERKILSLLYTDILGRVYNNLKPHPEIYFLTQSGLFKYFKEVKENLQAVNKIVDNKGSISSILDRVNKLGEHNQNYKNRLETMFKKSKTDIRDKITTEFEAKMKSVSKTKLREIFGDIVRFQKEPIKFEQELLAWEGKVHNSLLIRANLNVVSLIKDSLDILTQFAEIFGSAIEIGVTVQQSLVLGKYVDIQTNVSTEVLQRLHNKIEDIISTDINQTNLLLKNIVKQIKKYPDVLIDVSEQLLVVKEKLNSNKRFFTIKALRSDLLQVVRIKVKELSMFNEPTSTDLTPEQYKHTVTCQKIFHELSRLLKIVNLGRGLFDVYIEFENHHIGLEIIDEYLGTPNTKGLLEKGKINEDILYDSVYQLLQRIDDLIVETSQNPNEFSNHAWEISKFNIPIVLEKIKKECRMSMRTDERQDVIRSILKSLDEEFNSIAAIFDILHNYLQQTRLENHEKDTTFAINKGIKFTDVIFSKQYETIKNNIVSNIVMQYYIKAVHSFKQYVFPLAHIYLKDIVLPNHFNIYDDKSTVPLVITQIDVMLKKVDEYKKSVLRGDDVVWRKNFGGQKLTSERPFYTWKNEQNNILISKLLSGEKVTLTAEISKSDLRENAVKFNSVAFYFKSNNTMLQNSFNLIYEKMWVEATHLGNSQFRYGNNIYVIDSKTIYLTYMDEISSGEVLMGGQYKDIKDGNVMMSPYASWNVQLVPNSEDTTLDELLVFKDHVDLELGGNGYYISNEKLKALDLKVNKYYSPQHKYS